MDANQEKISAERVHLEVSQAFNEMQEKKTRLQKSLKSVIHKTRYKKTIETKFAITYVIDPSGNYVGTT